MRLSNRLVPLVLVAAALTGCGKAVSPLARQIGSTTRAVPSQAIGASSVAPDDAKVFAEDQRRAEYWAGDAVRVMAVHTTALGTSAISASANVYFSASRFHESQPAIFAARHYGFKFAAQFTEIPDRDLQRLAFNLKALPAATEVGSKLAFDLAKNFHPAAPAQPAQPTQTAAQAAESARLFLSSRAILVQSGTADPEWRFYGASQKFAINARTKEVQAPTNQLNPGDPLNGGEDVAVQRAAAVFLPTNLLQPNDRSAPKATN